MLTKDNEKILGIEKNIPFYEKLILALEAVYPLYIMLLFQIGYSIFILIYLEFPVNMLER